MNIYEFFEVLRRQKRLLAIGGGILVLLVVGAWLSIAPKYTATLRLIIVEEGITDLTDAGLATSEFFRIAAIYGDLLSSVEARQEIATDEGVEIQDLRVTTSDQASSLQLAVDSTAPEGAVAGALGGFTWLQERIRQSPEIVFTPSGGTAVPPLVVDPSGRLDVDVQLEVEPVYADVDPGLWFEIDTFEGDGFATPLALLESGTRFSSVINTDGTLAVTIGPETGQPLDEVELAIPDLPETFPSGISLGLRIGRGAVLVTEDTATLNPSALSLSWEDPSINSDGPGTVAVLMLNPDLEAIPVGQRRGPIISGAVLMLGVALLLILATIRDGWQRRREEGTLARMPVPASRDSV